MLSHLLHLRGIHSIVFEAKSRAYCEERVRAGVLEHTTVQMLNDAGVGARLEREGLRHEGIELGLNGVRHRIPFVELTGKYVTVYGQQEVVKDLIARRLADVGDLRFECGEVSLEGIDSDKPRIVVSRDGQTDEIHCDYIAGCDGFHGICRDAFPEDVLRIYERRLSLCLAWNLGGGGAVTRRACLHASFARFCALQHALAEGYPALSSMQAGRGYSKVER